MNLKQKKIWKNEKFLEFVRFVIVGIVATGIHYALYLLLKLWINVNVAYTIGYIFSLCCNLWLTSHYTFKKDVTLWRTGGFLISHGMNYLLHITLLNLFLWVGLPERYAPIPVFCIVIPVTFTLVRTVFKKLK